MDPQNRKLENRCLLTSTINNNSYFNLRHLDGCYHNKPWRGISIIFIKLVIAKHFFYFKTMFTKHTFKIGKGKFGYLLSVLQWFCQCNVLNQNLFIKIAHCFCCYLFGLPTKFKYIKINLVS